MTQQEIQQYVYDFLYDKDLPHQTIVAIMGNITGESSWDVDCIEVGSGIGYGLCQWSFGRRTTLETYIANNSSKTPLQCQCEFLWSELTGENTNETGASYQWISNPADSVTPDTSYSFSNEDFLKGNGSIAELTTAWCYCWERPAYETNHLDRRINSAETFNTTMSYGGSGGSGDSGEDVPKFTWEQLNKVIEWALSIAEDDSHGYDQENRWSPDYDCSSFVITAFEQAGIPLKQNGATYTGNLLDSSLKTGFYIVDSEEFDRTGYKYCDLLLRDGHTALYYQNNTIIHASINENGGITGGQTGDQTGKEICVADNTNQSWKYVLRLNVDTSGGGEVIPPKPSDEDTIYALLKKTQYHWELLTAFEVEQLDNLYLEDVCYLRHTFNKRKLVSGYNFLGNRLHIRHTPYIIISVDEVSGFVKVSDSIHNPCFSIVNPKLLLVSR